MKPVYLIAGIAIVAIVVITVTAGSTPDFDTMIVNKDCDAVGKITENNMSKATADQQIKLGFLLAGCMFGG